MAFENIVRPAQLGEVSTPRIDRSRNSARNWKPIVHRIAASGSATTGSGSVSWTINYYHKRKPTEKKKDAK